nr:MAG TPA: hypothetical protein [Caudoviricetes sp.]
MPPLDHHPAPAARPSPPDQDNQTQPQRQRGHRKPPVPSLFRCGFFAPI